MVEPVWALIDCERHFVVVCTPSGGDLIIRGEGVEVRSTFCSVARAKRYLQHGCSRFLAYVVNVRKEKKKSISEVPILCEFLDVFPNYLSGVPLKS